MDRGEQFVVDYIDENGVGTTYGYASSHLAAMHMLDEIHRNMNWHNARVIDRGHVSPSQLESHGIA